MNPAADIVKLKEQGFGFAEILTFALIFLIAGAVVMLAKYVFAKEKAEREEREKRIERIAVLESHTDDCNRDRKALSEKLTRMEVMLENCPNQQCPRRNRFIYPPNPDASTHI